MKRRPASTESALTVIDACHEGEIHIPARVRFLSGPGPRERPRHELRWLFDEKF
jgi:hypothetical protein